MNNTLTKLLFFLKSPNIPGTFTPITPKNFLVLLILTLLIIIPYALFLEATGMDQFDNIVEQMLKDNKWLVVISVILLAPILEEPVFRLHLDLKKSSIWWGIALGGLFLAQAWWLIVLFWMYLFYLLYEVNVGNPPRFKIVFWISATFFALIHLGNFTDFNFQKYFYWVPLMVGAQFLVGLVLSYIRLKHGMIWAILFHGVYNAVLIIPAVYFYEP